MHTPPRPADHEWSNFIRLFGQTPELVCVLGGPEHRFEFVNPAHVAVLGFDATGKTVREAQPESVEVHEILDRIYLTGVTAELKEIRVTLGHRSRYFNLTFAARYDSAGGVNGVLILGTEITEQVLGRESNKLQLRALELALGDTPLPQILELMVQTVELQTGGELFASILLVSPDGRCLLHGAAPSLPAAYNERVHGIAIGPNVGSCGTAAHFRERVVVTDIASDPRWADYKQFALDYGLRACWSKPILDAQGKLLGTFAFYSRTARGPSEREEQIVDISTQTTALILARRAEVAEKLASDAELKFTLASANLGTWTVDFAHGGRVRFSPAAAKIFGFAEEYPDPAAAIDRFIHPDDRSRVTQVLADAVAQGVPYRDEYRIVWPSGEIRWLHLRGRASLGDDGQVSLLSGIVMDITERKDAEERDAASRRLLELAASGGQVGFWQVNTELGTFNPDAQMARDWGIDLATFPRTFAAGMEAVHPDDRHIIHSGMAAALAGTSDYDKEFRVVWPDGTERWVQSKGQFYPGRDGKRTLFAGVSIDITERKLSEERLRGASVAAENANLAKSAFLTNMSHEIRTPLGAIMGFSGLLKNPELTRSESANFVAIIERNSQHLLSIVDDILDLSKVEAGKMIFEHIEFSLPDLLSDFASLMGLRARDKGIDFTLRIVSEIPELVVSDPTRLRQILNNVVGNAIKFTEHGSVDLTVGYDSFQLEILVRDTGRGISPEQAGRLFQAFVQADDSTTRLYGGTGLGLVLTKRLAAAMGGDFYLRDSELGRGSVFVARVRVALSEEPRFLAPESLHFTTQDVSAAEPPRKRLAGLRVLVVDDSPDNRTLLEVLLRQAGAAVDSAADGRVGVERALAGHYDVVLMDIQMPRLDGYQAMDLLNARGYGVPVVALTAHAMVEERQRARGKGFSDFMTKPIRQDALLELLEKISRGGTKSASGPAPREVLLVEDDRDLRSLWEEIFSDSGIACRTAANGSDAWQRLTQGAPPGLVLLDLTLPDMDGAEIVSRLKSDPRFADTRVIVVSGWDNLTERSRAMGADGCLAKPVQLAKIQQLISDYRAKETAT